MVAMITINLHSEMSLSYASVEVYMDFTKNEGHEESDRLGALDSFGIMDSAPELSFDQLAVLASTVCKTPIALISFINSTRQWFKSSVGIEIHEIPKFLSPCNQTIRNNDFYEIMDAQEGDGPYHEFLKKLGYRYYGGVPIVTDESNNVGTLCIIDNVPRKLTSDQIKTLNIISRQISDLLHLRRKYLENLQRLKELDEASLKSDRHAEEIAHKAGLRAMAELSSGLAYRILPLAYNIKGITSQVNTMDEEFKLMKHSADEIITVFDQLEKFISAEKEKSMALVELRSSLERVMKYLEYKIRKFNIKLNFHCEQDVVCIGNSAQIDEAFYAVLVNAIEAVEHMKKREINVTLKEINHKAVIKVEDTGRGVSETIAPFIFQPFFTTKGSYSLGVGLSLAQNLMQRHSGELKLEKAFDPTTFTLIFPKP